MISITPFYLVGLTMLSNGMGNSLDSVSDLTDNLIGKLFVLTPADLADTTVGKSGAAAVLQQQNPKGAQQRSTTKVENNKRFLKEQGRKIAGVALAGLVALAPLSDAQAAKSGGRVGGRAGFAAKSQQSSAPPAAAAPRTNVYVAPSIGVSPVPSYGFGGYGTYSPFGGYGYGGGFGGGMSTGTYLGLSVLDTILREQQRQAYLRQQLRTQEQLGRDQAQIEQLRAELKAQDAKVEGLKAKETGGDADRVKQLEKQLAEQQKQIEALKSAPAPVAR